MFLVPTPASVGAVVDGTRSTHTDGPPPEGWDLLPMAPTSSNSYNRASGVQYLGFPSSVWPVPNNTRKGSDFPISKTWYGAIQNSNLCIGAIQQG